MNARSILALTSCLLCAAPTLAQEAKRIDPDKAKVIATPLVEAAKKLDLPFKLTLDADKGTGVHADKAVGFILPSTKLTEDAIKKLDKEPVPIGILFTHKVTLVIADQPVPADQHRSTEITVGNDTVTVNVMPLAIGKVAGRLVLLVYTKDKTPALVTELVESAEKSEFPIDLDARRVGDNRAAAIINVLSRYRAAIQVAGQGE
jgi:hypothetical protein